MPIKNKKTDNGESYTQLQSELEELIAWFDDQDFDVEQAADKYKAAAAVIKKLQQKLTAASNKVKRVNLTFDD